MKEEKANFVENDNPSAKEVAQTFVSMLSNIEQEVGNDFTLEEIITELKKEMHGTADKKKQKELENSIKIAEILLKQQQIVDMEIERAVKDQEKHAFGYDQDVELVDQTKISEAKDELEAEAIAAESKKKKKKKKKGEKEFIDLPDELKDLEIKDKDKIDAEKAKPRSKGGMEHHTQRIR